jgi:hypothetical protein
MKVEGIIPVMITPFDESNWIDCAGLPSIVAITGTRNRPGRTRDVDGSTVRKRIVAATGVRSRGKGS